MKPRLNLPKYMMIALTWLLPIVGVILVGCQVIERFYTQYEIPADNKLEEHVEKLIKEKTGQDIDLTPSSPEDDRAP